MDAVARSVSALITNVEELRLPYVRLSTYIKVVLAGIPISVLLHDTASLWMPKARIPILSWFQRRWRVDPNLKLGDLETMRNAILFAGIVILFMNGTTSAADMPSDYLEQRLSNSNAVRAMTNEVYTARSNTYEVAASLMGEEEVNFTAAQQLRDAALRRRYLKESHSS